MNTIGVGELQENFWKLNGLCQKYHYMWFIEYRYYDKKYIGKVDNGNVNGQLAFIEAEYLDDLVKKMIEAIEKSSIE